MLVDYCDSCGENTELRYCAETDSYHCEDCQDEHLEYEEVRHDS